MITDIDINLINTAFHEYLFCDPFIYGTTAVVA